MIREQQALGGTDKRLSLRVCYRRPTLRSSPVAKSTKPHNYESRFSRVEADLLVLKWMTGTILGGVVALVLKAFIA